MHLPNFFSDTRGRIVGAYPAILESFVSNDHLLEVERSSGCCACNFPEFHPMGRSEIAKVATILIRSQPHRPWVIVTAESIRSLDGTTDVIGDDGTIE